MSVHHGDPRDFHVDPRNFEGGDQFPDVTELAKSYWREYSMACVMFYQPDLRGASLDTLRRRARYGGRKGARATRRLLACGVRP